MKGRSTDDKINKLLEDKKSHIQFENMEIQIIDADLSEVEIEAKITLTFTFRTRQTLPLRDDEYDKLIKFGDDLPHKDGLVKFAQMLYNSDDFAWKVFNEFQEDKKYTISTEILELHTQDILSILKDIAKDNCIETTFFYA